MGGMDDDDAPPGFETSSALAAEPTEPAEAAPAPSEPEEPPAEAQAADVDQPDSSLKTHVLKDEASEITTRTLDDSMYTSATTFEELGLSPELLQGLYDEMKFEKPSRIQATTLPMILSAPYRHLIAQAHNGSGKTTCFVLSMLSRSGLGRRD